MPAGLGVVLCIASGYVLVAVLWPRRPLLATELLLRLTISAGFGIGVFSVIYTLGRATGVRHLFGIDLAVFAILFGIFLAFRVRHSSAGPSPAPRRISETPRWAARTLETAFAIGFAAALYSAILRMLVHPHGEGWDAFSIWNLHARFLFRAGSAWRDGFTAMIPWSHPDYPLLLPAAIAHFWSLLGRETQAVPAAIGLVFTFVTVGLLFSTLAHVCGRTSATLGALALLGTPFFIELGTSQYADVPLSFFFLATLSLLCLSDHNSSATRSGGLQVLAGLAAGFAAWTKNEGLLFLCALLAARTVTQFRARSHQDDEWLKKARNAAGTPLLAAFARNGILLIGMLPMLLLIAWFRHSIAPPSDLFSDRTAALHKLLDPARYWVILKWYGKDFLRFGEWLVVPGTVLLIVFHFLLPRPRRSGHGVAVITGTMTCAFMFAGYFVIYLITPYEIYWHLRNSLDRLFLQLWPSAILLFFLTLPAVYEKTCGLSPSQNE